MHIGQRLKEAREEKDISLDKVQEETKIQKRYLIAIEQDAYDSLPGNFYARAFIREYALVVGIDPVELLAEFDDEYKGSSEEKPQYSRMDRGTSSKVSKSSSSFWSVFPTIIVVVLIISILFVGWLLIQNTLSDKDDDQSNQTNNNEIIRDNSPNDNENNENDANNAEDKDNDTANNENEDNDDEDEKEEVEGEFSVVEEGEGESPTSEMNFVTSKDEIKITFDSEEDAYVMINDDEEEVYFEGIIGSENLPDDIVVKDVETLHLNIGNTSGIKFSFNGEELKYPVDPQNGIHQRLTINIEKPE